MDDERTNEAVGRLRLSQKAETPFGVLRNKKPTNWLGQAKRRAAKIRPKVVEGNIFGRFFELR